MFLAWLGSTSSVIGEVMHCDPFRLHFRRGPNVAGLGRTQPWSAAVRRIGLAFAVPAALPRTVGSGGSKSCLILRSVTRTPVRSRALVRASLKRTLARDGPRPMAAISRSSPVMAWQDWISAGYEVFRYRLENILTIGSRYQLISLILVLLGVLAAGAVSYWWLCRPEVSLKQSFFKAWSLLSNSDSFEDERDFLSLFIVSLLSIAHLFLFSLFISSMQVRLATLAAGYTRVIERGHYLILGWYVERETDLWSRVSQT